MRLLTRAGDAFHAPPASTVCLHGRSRTTAMTASVRDVWVKMGLDMVRLLVVAEHRRRSRWAQCFARD